MKVIKQTKSISPLSGKTLEAEVVVVDDSVFLRKTDENGTEHLNSIEKNYELYKNFSEQCSKEFPSIKSIHVHCSSECNSNCHLCYASNNKKNSFIKPDELEKILKPYKKKSIVLAGREPTCHPELARLIRVVSKNNYPIILTNGLALADYKYSKSLKDEGLDGITFSLNGFVDEIFVKINGQPLLQTKLRALDNLKKLRIETEISMTIIKGINENEIQNIVNYCFENIAWVRDLRIRSAVQVGKHLDTDTIHLSDLMIFFAKAINCTYEDIFNACKFTNLLGEVFNIKYFPRRICSANFFIKKKKVFEPVGSRVDTKKIQKARFKKIILMIHVVREFGMFFSAILLSFTIFKLARKNRFLKTIKGFAMKESNILGIFLRSWPNKYNIDLDENRKCSTLCIDEKGVSGRFCHKNLMEEFDICE